MASHVIFTDGTEKTLDGPLTMEEVYRWVEFAPTSVGLRDGLCMVFDQYAGTNGKPLNAGAQEKFGMSVRGTVLVASCHELSPFEQELSG
jgi:hypothetical protein